MDGGIASRETRATKCFTVVEFPRDLLDQRQEGYVEEQNLVAGVVDDVGDLLGEEPRIDRVDDRAAARDGVIKLVVAVGVPGERAHAVLMADAKPDQRVGEPARPGRGLRIGVAPNPAFGQPADDLVLAVYGLRMPQDRGDDQGHVHHFSLHLGLPNAAFLH